MKLFISYDNNIKKYNIFVEQYKQIIISTQLYQVWNTFVDGEDASTTSRGVCSHWRIK